MVAETKKEKEDNVKSEDVKGDSKEQSNDNLVSKVKQVFEPSKPTPAEYVDKPTRQKIAEEVGMVKIAVDGSGNWLFRRSDRLTEDDKKSRQILIDSLKKSMSKQQIYQKLLQEGIRY